MENDFKILLTQEYRSTASAVYKLIQNGFFLKLTGADVITFDCRIDGKFSLLFHDRGMIQGSVSELIPGKKISLIWNVKGFGRDEETGTVTILLVEDANKVTAEITHRGIRSTESAEAKQRAWSEILSGIRKELALGNQ